MQHRRVDTIRKFIELSGGEKEWIISRLLRLAIEMKRDEIAIEMILLIPDLNKPGDECPESFLRCAKRWGTERIAHLLEDSGAKMGEREWLIMGRDVVWV